MQKKAKTKPPGSHQYTEQETKQRETDNTTITITQREENNGGIEQHSQQQQRKRERESERRFNIRIATWKRKREWERERAEAKWTRYFGKFRKKLTPEEQVNIEKINKAVRWWQTLAWQLARAGTTGTSRENKHQVHTWHGQGYGVVNNAKKKLVNIQGGSRQELKRIYWKTNKTKNK